ncbi:MATE family efflux transporter [Wenyingzhuangia sp. 2_MG-2023]|uniref:MATE family efflux transporter n=1 Tax=Wenyingzhuangia sp. 2_MG-2023 TaxID=3062639 RepID=UPI0026E3B79A|nr:MATE family efflux transporter [Wenyingzhuangia sp. 2_MG-2023]MDO6736492.1 MATE family efflux transporter [Wenyingzhuangia sp. 2_MG-2023]MDO6801201.1 MATE family efflux transporter [Wenyingzhuangia sp. 1_MG-2023]
MRNPKLSFKHINSIAVPAIISGVIEPILSLTDTAVVGNVSLNAKEALAAVGIAGSFIATLGWVFTQSKVAIAALVAEYLGKKELDKIMGLPAQMIGINIVLGTLVYAITYFATVSIFKWYHAEDLVLEYTISYYRIRALGFPFLLFIVSVFAIFRGLQNTFWPMVISAIGAVLNIGLDFILVYGIEGWIPAMHVEGAAWASLIAQLVMSVLALILLFLKTPFRLKIQWKIHPELKRMISISLNMLVRTIALNTSLILSNAYATKYGSKYIAAFTIAFQIWLFFAFFIDGYASVSAIIAGKFKGEKNYKDLALLVKIITKYALVVSVSLSFIFFIMYPYIGQIFTNDVEVIATFEMFFWMVLIMQPLNAIAFVYDDVYKGMAEAKTLRNTQLIATFIGFVPTLLILDYFDFKIYAIWIAFLVWMLFRALLLRIKFVKLLKLNLY